MKISFSTLGCPQWDLPTICRRGREYGFDAVDFRGLQAELDVTLLPEFNRDIAATKRRLADHGLAVSGISSSIELCNAQRRTANVEEAKRTIPVALALDCANIRVVGAGTVAGAQRETAVRLGLDCLAEILSLPDATRLRWLLETHDNWIASADCRRLLDGCTHPAFGCTWDIGHTTRIAGESPAQTYAALGSRIAYVHLKDAVYDPTHPHAMPDGWRYVLPGTGQLPLAEAIAVLRQHGYAGYYVFEHEKRWHPRLPEPEEAFPHFVRWIRSLPGGQSD